MSATKNTIAVWTNNPHRKEALASGAMYPGMCVQRTSATVDTVIVQATAEVAPTPLLILEEDELQGKELTEVYATGKRVFFRTPYPGDYFGLLLADGQNVAKADFLTPVGDGTWKKATGSMIKVAQALEAKDLSASSNTANDIVLAEIC